MVQGERGRHARNRRRHADDTAARDVRQATGTVALPENFLRRFFWTNFLAGRKVAVTQ
jgi:hypothetical protein